MKRRAVVAVCALASLLACRKERMNATGGPKPAPTVWTAAAPIELAEATPLVREDMGPGDWATFDAHGDRAIYGWRTGESITLWPGNRSIPTARLELARFSADAEKILVVKMPRGFELLAANDGHVILSRVEAFTPFWTTRGTIGFDNEGQVFEMSPTSAATPKLIGPPLPILLMNDEVDQRVAKDLSRVVIGNQGRARSIDLVTGKTTPLSEKSGNRYAISSDLAHACVHESEQPFSIWCDGERTADSGDPFAIGFAKPTQLWVQHGTRGGRFSLLDLETKTVATMNLPDDWRAEALMPLPGGRYAVATSGGTSDRTAFGVVDFKKRRTMTLPYFSGWAGTGEDDRVFAVRHGQAVARVRLPRD